MAAKRKRTPAGPQGGRSRQPGHTPPASRRQGRRPLLVAVGVAMVAVLAIVAIVAIGFGRGSDSVPVAWATLNTADVHALAFAPDDPSHLYFGHHAGLLESRDGGRSWQPTSLSGADAMNVRAAGDQRIEIAEHEVYLEGHTPSTASSSAATPPDWADRAADACRDTVPCMTACTGRSPPARVRLGAREPVPIVGGASVVTNGV